MRATFNLRGYALTKKSPDILSRDNFFASAQILLLNKFSAADFVTIAVNVESIRRKFLNRNRGVSRANFYRNRIRANVVSAAKRPCNL